MTPHRSYLARIAGATPPAAVRLRPPRALFGRTGAAREPLAPPPPIPAPASARRTPPASTRPADGAPPGASGAPQPTGSHHDREAGRAASFGGPAARGRRARDAAPPPVEANAGSRAGPETAGTGLESARARSEAPGSSDAPAHGDARGAERAHDQPRTHAGRRGAAEQTAVARAAARTATPGVRRTRSRLPVETSPPQRAGVDRRSTTGGVTQGVTASDDGGGATSRRPERAAPRGRAGDDLEVHGRPVDAERQRPAAEDRAIAAPVRAHPLPVERPPAPRMAVPEPGPAASTGVPRDAVVEPVVRIGTLEVILAPPAARPAAPAPAAAPVAPPAGRLARGFGVAFGIGQS